MSLQQFSIFHEATSESLKDWHRPYAKLFENNGLVLDVGCGPGYFGETLKELGVESEGIDIDPEMVNLARNQGHSVTLGDHNTIKEMGPRFSGVHISHVVEHLWGDDLTRLLKNAVAVLKPGGLLVIRTPNWGNRFVRETLFWMDHTHKRPYPRELLVRMLNDLGMKEVQSGYEPFGMNDTFVVTVLPPSKNDVSIHFSSENKPKCLSAVKLWVKKRLRRFLNLE